MNDFDDNYLLRTLGMSMLTESLFYKNPMTTTGSCVCAYSFGNELEEKEMLKYLKPERVIYNPPSTIAYFPDGDKIVVKCAENETFVPEIGVMACIIKKLYGKRSEFLRTVKEGYLQPPRQLKKAEKTETEEKK